MQSPPGETHSRRNLRNVHISLDRIISSDSLFPIPKSEDLSVGMSNLVQLGTGCVYFPALFVEPDHHRTHAYGFKFPVQCQKNSDNIVRTGSGYLCFGLIGSKDIG